MNEQAPLPRPVAARAEARCAAEAVRLLARRRTHLRHGEVGRRLHFADGTSAAVFRETVVDGPARPDPTLLVLEFRLRWLRGRGHQLFRRECILNTPLFVGFPGFVSKLWLERDERERYRGVYEWLDPAGAAFYARSLWRVLELVSVPGSIGYRVVPRMARARVLRDPQVLGAVDPDERDAWWRIVAAS